MSVEPAELPCRRVSVLAYHPSRMLAAPPSWLTKPRSAASCCAETRSSSSVEGIRGGTRSMFPSASICGRYEVMLRHRRCTQACRLEPCPPNRGMSAQLAHSPQLPRVQPSYSPHRRRLIAARLAASSAAVAADEAAPPLVTPPLVAPPFEAAHADADEDGVAVAVAVAEPEAEPEAEAALRDWVCLRAQEEQSSSRAAASAAAAAPDW